MKEVWRRLQHEKQWPICETVAKRLSVVDHHTLCGFWEIRKMLLWNDFPSCDSRNFKILRHSPWSVWRRQAIRRIIVTGLTRTRRRSRWYVARQILPLSPWKPPHQQASFAAWIILGGKNLTSLGTLTNSNAAAGVRDLRKCPLWHENNFPLCKVLSAMQAELKLGQFYADFDNKRCLNFRDGTRSKWQAGKRLWCTWRFRGRLLCSIALTCTKIKCCHHEKNRMTAEIMNVNSTDFDFITMPFDLKIRRGLLTFLAYHLQWIFLV